HSGVGFDRGAGDSAPRGPGVSSEAGSSSSRVRIPQVHRGLRHKCHCRDTRMQALYRPKPDQSQSQVDENRRTTMKKPAGVSQIPRSSLTTEEAREVFEDLSRKATRRRSRRRVQRLLLAAGVLIGSALAVWGLFGLFETEGRQPTGPAPASISTPQPSGSPIILPPEGRTQFSPAPSGTQSALSADQAVSRYETQNSAFHLPRDATAQLGYYTAAVGDGSYRFHDRLAWGFSWPGC